jgi:hypothetical protein
MIQHDTATVSAKVFVLLDRRTFVVDLSTWLIRARCNSLSWYATNELRDMMSSSMVLSGSLHVGWQSIGASGFNWLFWKE